MKDPVGRLTGQDYSLIDPVFAGRIANCCSTKITEGKRSSARQTDLYNQYLEWKRTGKGDIHSAAKPGTSWHEFGLAIDTSTQPIRGMTNAQLKPYGLCKPIASEGWHIQPIETINLGSKANTAAAKALYPVEVEEEKVEEIKAIINGTEKTISAINVNGSNFVQLRDLTDVVEVSYDTIKKMPVIGKKGD